MDSGLIGKIDKAKRYAEEKNRVKFEGFSATIRGDNNEHQVQYQQGKWQCTCNYFSKHGVCAHTLGMELILEGMVTPAEVHDETSASI